MKPTTLLEQLLSAEAIVTDKGYTLATLEQQKEFDDKRNYNWTTPMLRDRKLLVETEITKLTDTAAQTYFDAIRGEIELTVEYDKLRERITDLQHERKMIQLLLDKGNE